MSNAFPLLPPAPLQKLLEKVVYLDILEASFNLLICDQTIKGSKWKQESLRVRTKQNGLRGLWVVLIQWILHFSFSNYLWLCWVFIATHGLSLVAVSRSYSSLQREGFSLPWLLLFPTTSSREDRLSGCGTRAYLPCSMWDLHGPGIKPMSPVWAGGFLTTGPPG